QNSWRQEKEILIMDVNKEFEFSLSEYFSEEKTKSMLVVPIFKNQEVIGIIYCENNVSTNVFSEERIQIVRALALQMSISIENSRLYTTFERFVPKRFLNQLGMKHIFDIEQGDSIEKKMNVLFIDIRNFTGYSETHTAEETFKFINDYLSRVGPIIHENNGFIDKFIGDGVMALFPGESSEALNACIEIQTVLKNFTAEEGYHDWELKVGMGLHYDSLMLGIVGETQHVEGTVIGDAVNVASRLDSFNKEFSTRCLMSDSFKKNLKNTDEYHLRRLGRVSLIGRKKLINVWQVFDVYPDKELRELLIETRPNYEDAYDLYIKRNFQEAKKIFKEIIDKNPKDLVETYYYESCGQFIKNPPPNEWNGKVEMKIK
ncbi:MAG: adenylate/guanylate cyclase domain-containing protein, partial [Chlamydiota bacterium]